MTFHGLPWDITTEAWRTADYASLLVHTHPEVLARVPAGQFFANRPRRAHGMPFDGHLAVWLSFGWRADPNTFEVWSGLFAFGPLGFARLSQNPAAVTAVLAHDRVDLDDAKQMWPTGILGFSQLLEAVVRPAREPDSMFREDRTHFMHAGMFTEDNAHSVTTGTGLVKIEPDDADEWAALAERIVPVTADLTPAGYVIEMCIMEALGGRRVEFATHSITVARETYAITATREPVGALRCNANPYPRF